MIGEILLNITRLNGNKLKIHTNKYTYIYIALDLYSNVASINSIPDIVHIGEIIKVCDNGTEFLIFTESGKNTITLETHSNYFGYFSLIDKF